MALPRTLATSQRLADLNSTQIIQEGKATYPFSWEEICLSRRLSRNGRKRLTFVNMRIIMVYVSNRLASW